MAIERIGVVGAGTMGAGIALTALYAGLDVTLHDVDTAVLEAAQAYIEEFLTKKEQLDALEKLHLTSKLRDMKKAQVVIEAIVEEREAKIELFGQLDSICTKGAILATNTSTIAVTSIASETKYPERMVGMHFFNPAPVMKLVEVIRAAQTSEATLKTIFELAEAMDKAPVLAQDSPGFIVNRVARPYYLEALRIVQEGIATPEQVDMVMEMGGGFRMGPFRLLDLIGLDISLAASQSIYEQTFHEPRFRPTLIQAQMVQAKLLGRKTGKGFYDYGKGAPEWTLPDAPVMQQKRGIIGVRESNALALRCRKAGYTIATNVRNPAYWIADTATSLPGILPQDATIFANAATVTLDMIQEKFATRIVPVIGYDDSLIESAQLVTLVRNPHFNEAAHAQAQVFFEELGLVVLWLDDHPGLILSRILCQIINEAAFAVGEGVADMNTVDLAMRLGVNYPAGPFDWGRSISYGRVVRTLDHLYNYYHEDRYRVAPVLRRLALG